MSPVKRSHRPFVLCRVTFRMRPAGRPSFVNGLTANQRRMRFSAAAGTPLSVAVKAAFGRDRVFPRHVVKSRRHSPPADLFFV